MRLFYSVLVLAFALTFIGSNQPATGISERHERFGLIEPHDAPTHADALNVGWGRARFHWATIQPTGPDEWIDAELSDDELSREISSGRETVGLLIGIPAWARDERGLPLGLHLENDDPE